MTHPDSTTNTGAVEELRPCPFCGGKAQLANYIIEAVVRCSSCFALLKRSHSASDDTGVEMAFDAWNTRATPTPASDAGVIERAAAEIERVTVLNVKARRDRADDALAFEFQGLGDVLAKVVRALSPPKEPHDD